MKMQKTQSFKAAMGIGFDNLKLTPLQIFFDWRRFVRG